MEKIKFSLNGVDIQLKVDVKSITKADNSKALLQKELQDYKKRVDTLISQKMNIIKEHKDSLKHLIEKDEAISMLEAKNKDILDKYEASEHLVYSKAGKINELESLNNELRKANSTFNKSHVGMLNKIESAEREEKEAKDLYHRNVSDYNELSEAYNNLKATHKDNIVKLDALRNEYDNLLEDHNKLEINYAHTRDLYNDNSKQLYYADNADNVDSTSYVYTDNISSIPGEWIKVKNMLTFDYPNDPKKVYVRAKDGVITDVLHIKMSEFKQWLHRDEWAEMKNSFQFEVKTQDGDNSQMWDKGNHKKLYIHDNGTSVAYISEDHAKKLGDVWREIKYAATLSCNTISKYKL